MKPIVTGILIGFICKEKIQYVLGGIIFNSLNIFHGIRNNFIKKEVKHTNQLITKVNFVCKVNNQELFDESFKNDNKIIISPYWDYLNENNVIKIDLDNEFLEYINIIIKNSENLSFDQIIDLKNNSDEHLVSIDLPFFKKLGKVCIYVYYSIDSKKLINVYEENDNLSLDDFTIQESTPLKECLNKLICASLKSNSVKNEYVTTYLRMFVNNKNVVTPELIFYNYDKIPFNTSDNMTITCIIDNKCVEFSSNQKLKQNI
jgi:hypothetical protein